MRRHVFIVLTLIVMSLGKTADAAEAGGRYHPGSLSSRALWLPFETRFAVQLWHQRYEGTLAEANVPVAGERVSQLDTDYQELALGLVWNSRWELPGDWDYAAALKLPYVTSEMTAETASELESGRHAKVSGLGDLELTPLMASRSTSEHWHQQVRLSLFVPTGNYEPGRLANTGYNYWTLRPAVSLSYLEPVLGQSFSVHAGLDIHSKNRQTDYLSGIQASVESTLSQYVILLGGFTGVGLSGYWTRQLTADGGNGAMAGSFKSRSLGVGPVLSYRRLQSGSTLNGELKWLTTLNAQQQFDGEMLSLNISLSY
ncbi:SphA family protein [Photobacterium atrarenae]|uniref:Transporter n=1 Tax=Photobacterium atrarenae TaxID=865757 RepID=A0ABY5GP04_9GAMM|nr:transporter [Photobacterium atrarenae]UTV30414.1 transporter [Photobacterium atrarenae]